MILRTGFCVFTAFFFVYELFGVKSWYSAEVLKELGLK